MVDDYLSYENMEKRIRWWVGDVVDVFISHANSEREAALVIRDLLKKAFGDDCEIFVSSGKKSMKPGDWFEQVVSNLKNAEAVLVPISEETHERPWINYETGVAEGGQNRRTRGDSP
jgi:TIR domain